MILGMTPQAELFRAALAALDANDIPAATAACEKLHGAAPGHPAVLQLQAEILFRKAALGPARAAARQSLEARPLHAPTLMLLGRVELAAGKAAAAIAPLRAAMAADPARHEAGFLLCQALAVAGDPSLAAAMQALAQQTPDQIKAWLALGLKLREAGNLPAARDALGHAQPLDVASFVLGLTCQDLNDEAGATAAFAAALAARPGFAEAAVNLGIARQRLGDMLGAMAAYRQAIQIRPDTLPRIAQAVTAASTGTLWLNPTGLRRELGL
jgi:tetratricopeptide (TPR) repeat protein